VIGNVIDGSYRVDRLLGEGGFGVVYQCTELELDRVVAVKMLRPGPIGERDLRRFNSEGRNLASLNHPNVVQIYRFGNSDGSPYIAMEFLKGRTLRSLIEKDRPSTPRILEMMRQVASGLAAIHALGTLHRDLSPNNIMVVERGVAKILDLGLAKTMGAMSSMDSAGALVGTMAYISPEQLNREDAGIGAEIFVFGIVLYEALAGVHPFRAEHPMSVLYNIAQRPQEPIEKHLPDCPPLLSDLVERCLAKRPEERPATMAEVEEALASLLGRSDVQSATMPITAPMRGPRDTPRNPYLHRVMLKHRDDFFGRTQEIKRIYARFNATPPGSISVVGDRKIGKSSLLNYVYMRGNRERYLEHPAQMVMVFLDLQQEKSMSMETFVRTLLGIAELELRGRLDLTGCAHSLDGVREMVQRLDAGGFRLVLLLDEFETVTRNPSFQLEFFSFLRYLANHYNVAYLTSSERDLQILCHTKEISDSPFFNIFSTLKLSVFKREEAEELIRVPSERMGKPLGAHAERILELSGLFPFFIQMACSYAIEYWNEHPDAAAPDFVEVRRRFYEEATLHFRYTWESLDEHERATLSRIAAGKSLPDSLRHVGAELEARHLVEMVNQKPRLFASTFEQFVKTKSGDGAKPSMLGRLFGGKG
jgi:serine/threonine protein kinase